MKKYRLLITGFLAFSLLLAGAYLLYDRLSSDYKAGNLVGNSITESTSVTAEENRNSESYEASDAPDFTVIDSNGKSISLSDFKGKPVVLNLWASWCPPCKEELPDFDAACKNHTDVQFMMVNMTDGSRETVEIATNYIEEKDFGFPVFYDTNSSCAIAYNATSLPATYFIDADGKLQAKATGMIDSATLEKGIVMIK